MAFSFHAYREIPAEALPPVPLERVGQSQRPGARGGRNTRSRSRAAGDTQSRCCDTSDRPGCRRVGPRPSAGAARSTRAMRSTARNRPAAARGSDRGWPGLTLIAIVALGCSTRVTTAAQRLLHGPGLRHGTRGAGGRRSPSRCSRTPTRCGLRPLTRLRGAARGPIQNCPDPGPAGPGSSTGAGLPARVLARTNSPVDWRQSRAMVSP